MLIEVAALPILLAGLYLIALAGVALIAPRSAEGFLTRLATTPFAHFAELSLRLTVGAALILFAPRMLLPEVFSIFGWVLVVTTLGMLVVPWRWHHRFARWSVPHAARHLTLFAVGSFLGGFLLLIAVLLGH
jgi:hypothetical protein